MKERVHVIITGDVQGVFYRASARSRAGELGLSGWVRNRSDGAVEAVAEGPREALEAFVVWCGHGPPSADVANVSTTWSQATGEFAGGFSVTR